MLGLKPVDLINLAKDILALVRVDQAKLHKVNLSLAVIVEDVEDQLIVLNWKLYAGVLAACDELLEAQTAVEVLVDASEGAPVIAKFLLNTNVDLLQQLLDVPSFGRRVRLHHELGLVLRFLTRHLVGVNVRECVHRYCILEVVRVIIEI